MSETEKTMVDKSPSGPQNGDVVIWELEPHSSVPTYMVKVEGSGSAPEYPDAQNIWSKVYARAKELAGP
jgi:hypothetical protein